jgi:hypothetical protein
MGTIQKSKLSTCAAHWTFQANTPYKGSVIVIRLSRNFIPVGLASGLYIFSRKYNKKHSYIIGVFYVYGRWLKGT